MLGVHRYMCKMGHVVKICVRPTHERLEPSENSQASIQRLYPYSPHKNRLIKISPKKTQRFSNPDRSNNDNCTTETLPLPPR